MLGSEPKAAHRDATGSTLPFWGEVVDGAFGGANGGPGRAIAPGLGATAAFHLAIPRTSCYRGLVKFDFRPLALLLLAACAHGAPANTAAKAANTQVGTPIATPHATTLDALTPNVPVDGFEPIAVLVDGEDRARGARFVHVRTHFVFDYLAIESAPQAMIYATTYPTSDAGEPHTQEHLLLGKGNKGRFHGNFEHVMLAESSAFTAQYRTTYHFMTSAGVDGFWDVLRVNFDSLLHPDYSDEEIRREVRDFGIAKDSAGVLSLDEKGTVYNEMVRTLEQPESLAWLTLTRMVYGADHPLAFESGGTPEGIRGLTPEMIRRFHADHYWLGNMGMIGAFPSSVPLTSVLVHVGEQLDAFGSNGPNAKAMSDNDLPPPHGSASGSMSLVDYPFATVDHPSVALFSWPATRTLDADEKMELDLFLQAFAEREGSTLYDALIDRKTRVLDFGATNVWGWASNERGHPVVIGLENMSAAHADEESLRKLRATILAQLAAIAALPDGSKGLEAFAERLKARIIELRRWYDKQLDTPPEFGVRGIGDTWIRELTLVMKTPGFRKSLVRKAGIDRMMAITDAKVNPWRDRIRAWGLLEAPYAVATRASTDLRAKLDRDRAARVDAELARLVSSYGAHDSKEALAKRSAEIDRATEELARAEASVPMPPFVHDPPMTLDDTLAWNVDKVRGVPIVRSMFETMKSATVGIAFSLDSLPEDALPYLAILPALIRDSGVIRDGKAIPYDEMRDRLRRDLLSMNVYLSTSYDSGRAELVIEAAGNDVEETKRALGWMGDFLASPDWRAANLPRLRDLLEQEAARLHDVMAGPEENWLTGAANAYRRQDRRVLVHAASFLTAAHDARRIAWRLAGDADAKAVARAITSLGSAGKKLDRARLAKLAAAIAANDGAKVEPDLARWIDPIRKQPVSVRAHLAKAGSDLGALLGDVPDGSLAADWQARCAQIAADVQRAPSSTLDALENVLRALRHAPLARGWVIGSSKHQAAIGAELDHLLASLDSTAVAGVARASKARVLDRARARGAKVSDPSYVALVNPSTANGALVHSRPLTRFTDTNDEALIDLLAANVFGGTGSHSFYKRVWGAGLAYAGNVDASPFFGRMRIYSDRCADVPQLLRFLANDVEHAPNDPKLVDYALAPAFGSRVGDTYETRGEAMAIDLVEGRTAAVVRAFHERLLALKARPGLADAMHARIVPVYAPLLPSLPQSVQSEKGPPDTVRFLVGPESIVTAYEKAIGGDKENKANVVRLYARDFWDDIE